MSGLVSWVYELVISCLDLNVGRLDLMLDVWTCISGVWTCISAVWILVAHLYTYRVSVYLLDRAWAASREDGWRAGGRGKGGGQLGRRGAAGNARGRRAGPGAGGPETIEASLLWALL